MKLHSIIFVVVVAFAAAVAAQGAVGGSVWPQPVNLEMGAGGRVWLDARQGANVDLPAGASPVLVDGAKRYASLPGALFFPFGSAATTPSGAAPLTVSVAVADGGRSANLSLGVDESYSLSVTFSGGRVTAQVKAGTVFGALYALESLSQLIQWDADVSAYFIEGLPTTITDSPRFPWRGLLVDTARHYLHPNTIKSAIDVLAYNKYNVLHWHVTDAQSFPIESKLYPKLTLGAYNKRAVYSHEVVRDIVSYGFSRGVRVLPEFDIPGHAAGFSYGYPEVTANCPRYSGNINNVALDVSNPFTYELLKGFLGEMAGLFSDEYMHLGGDEVVFGCWFNDPKIAQWAASKGFSHGAQIEQYFEQQLQAMVLPGFQNQINKKMVVWEELFENGVSLRSDIIVQVWSSRDLLQQVLNAGHQALLSQGYYLDKQIPNPDQTFYEWVDTWKNFYTNEPLNGLSLTPAQKKLLLGGEAAMWSEQVDDTNFHSRVWPRASATGERLWSPQHVNDVSAATPRLAAFRCHLARRGVGGGPVMPDFCDLPRYHQ